MHDFQSYVNSVLCDGVVIFFKTIYNKTIISFAFCDILNNHKVSVSLSVISSAFGSAINTYLDLDYTEYHKKLIQ